MRSWHLGLVLLCITAVAHANPAADELGQHGVDLAASGRFSEAIEAFKAADRIESNAAHSCLIALAYTRRELWSQAEIFLARCHALGASELPDWIPDLESLIAERLGEATVAAVHIDVAPAGAPAQLSVSSFLPDETFAPGTTIHLSRGHHVITATAAGFEDEHYSIDIADTSPKLVVIQLYRPGTRPKPPSPLPRAMMIGGAATIAAGAVAYGVMGIGWLKLRDRTTDNFGGAYESMYVYGRVASLSLFSAGAALAIAGYVLRVSSHAESPVAAVAPVPGGGMVVIGWQR
ncbi:MAG TPA: hypothetical protein VGL61_23400 [Kofleriaceae bacterium]